jgi:hypothetical protein
MFLCNECDEPYESNGDCSGICQDCRDAIELRREIDAMDEETYVRFMAERTIANDNRAINLTRDGLIRALTPTKHPEAAE